MPTKLFKESKKKVIKDSCEKCGLYKNCLSPKMPYTGQGKKKILIIAEAPGKKEDETGTQLIGETGQFLRRVLEYFNIYLDEDCWKTNAIICRPEKNKTPTTAQISLCRKNLLKTIEETQPEKIIVLGKIALQALIGDRMSVTSIEKWIGWTIPDQHFKCWIFPTYHPSYIIRDMENIVLFNTFKDHIKQALIHDKKFFNISENIKIIERDEAITFMQSIQEDIVIDIETTGLKPYREGHKIVCMSITTKEKTVSFKIYDDSVFISALKKILESYDIGKIAHNLKFEHTWFKEILNIIVNNWIWDTQLFTHIEDNRTGITGLKFQTYINFGVTEYDHYIIKYLEDITDGFNKILDADPIELLAYNALDSFYTYKLYELQKEKNENKAAIDLFQKGSLVFSEIERSGIKTKKGYYQLQNKELTALLENINTWILESGEVEKWNKERPQKYDGKEFNHNSSQQLSTLLFSILKYKPIKETKKGAFSVDIEVLENLDSPFVQKVLNYRKIKKIRDTFIQGFIDETEDNYIHPFFNLNTVTTYRSSSSNPNLQNIPKHDEIAHKYIRSGIIPREGRQLVEVDYSGIEVRVSACYHKDPVMIAYINNPDSDMHRDQAKEIFILDEVTREQRQLAKNGFVFPEFYGDYFVNCALAIWKKMDGATREHLKEKKIRNYNQFQDHMQEIEYNFWYNKFKVYTQWKKEWYKQYEKKGYFESYTGFTYRGVLEKNKVINFPIQGSAFHCLLWSVIQTHNFLKENKCKTRIIGQIHDSIIFDMCPEEKEFLKSHIRKIMCDDIREHWKWLIVPLDIEMEASDINGNWFEMKKEKI